MIKVKINTDSAVAFAKTLHTMGKSAIPYAIKSTLNAAVFDVKKTTMPEGAKKEFVERKPNFFKANSKVEMAQGNNVENMKATVGFVKLSGKGNTVEDLEQQEKGGNIGGRSFIALKGARSGSSWNKNVRPNNRITKIKKRIIDTRNATGRNTREQFIKSAVFAGKGGMVIGDRATGRGNKILWSIRSIKRVKGNTVVKSVPLFAVKSRRKVKVAPTKFMETASLRSQKKMDKFFNDAAQKQIQRLRK